MTYVIREAKIEEFDFFFTLAKEEGWNPGLHDAAPLFSIDPHGFFIGELDGKKIGCVSAVAYNDTFGFLGFYIVIPEHRGKGFGIQLWNHAMRYMGDRCVGLDGVVAQQENYKKSLFNLYYKHIRFEGRGKQGIHDSLVSLDRIPFDVLSAYDSSIFGLNRDVFLKQWIAMPESVALTKTRGNKIEGYGMIRRCSNGFKIGPLFANDLSIAKEIYEGLCGKAGDAPVFLDVPASNLPAMTLAADAQLKKVFETARMYNKQPPNQRVDHVFGVTTFEVG